MSNSQRRVGTGHIKSVLTGQLIARWSGTSRCCKSQRTNYGVPSRKKSKCYKTPFKDDFFLIGLVKVDSRLPFLVQIDKYIPFLQSEMETQPPISFRKEYAGTDTFAPKGACTQNTTVNYSGMISSGSDSYQPNSYAILL